MSCKFIAVMALTIATCFATHTANAIVVTLDSSTVTVVRPTTGTATANFTGHIDISAGFEPASIQSDTLFDAAGHRISGFLAVPNFDPLTGRFNLDGLLFSVLVGATDPLGLYAFDFSLVNPVTIRYFECPIGGPTNMNSCNRAIVPYAVNLVGSLSVPEPAGIALLGLGLCAFAIFMRRRKERP